MDGTALYECVVVVFIAQVYAFASGIDFGIAEQMIVVLLALLTSIGVAGIPAASLVAIALILPAVGLPVEAIAIVPGRRSPARYVPHGRQRDQRSGDHRAGGAHRRRRLAGRPGLMGYKMPTRELLASSNIPSAATRLSWFTSSGVRSGNRSTSPRKRSISADATSPSVKTASLSM